MSKKRKEIIAVTVFCILLYLIVCIPIWLGIWEHGWDYLDKTDWQDRYGQINKTDWTPRHRLWLGAGITLFCMLFLLYVISSKKKKTKE